MRRASAKTSRARRGAASFLDDAALRINLSFVLHEHSQSESVRRTASACLRHLNLQSAAGNRIAGRLRSSDTSALVGGPAFHQATAQTVLTASLGVPRLLAMAARTHPRCPDVRFVDRGVEDDEEVQFFRAPARLALPRSPAANLVVAAALLRPGGRSAELRWSGPYRWPEDRVPVIHALEALIQPFAMQWMPPEALWRAPAEQLLASEVRLPQSPTE